MSGKAADRDHGITHFDLANNYGSETGSAEKNLGLILKEELAAWRDPEKPQTGAGLRPNLPRIFSCSMDSSVFFRQIWKFNILLFLIIV